MDNLFTTKADIAARHKKLFDLLRNGDISVNPVEKERALPVQPRLRAEQAKQVEQARQDDALTDLQRAAAFSLLFGER